MTARNYVLVTLAVLCCLVAWPAAAEWSHDPLGNNLVCTAEGDQAAAQMISDGAGGAIIVWMDERFESYSGKDIFAQRLDAAGDPLWAADGVAVCTAVNSQYSPTLVSDDAGGAIITWWDGRSGVTIGSFDIFAQRLDADGNALWIADGVAVCDQPDRQVGPEIVSDGAGGAIIAWIDERWLNQDIWAQRVDPDGNRLWTEDGDMVCVHPAKQERLQAASDGEGGAIFCWQDERPGEDQSNIYAQRMDANGIPRWTPDGVALSPTDYIQSAPRMGADGEGGAIITWKDARNDPEYDIYAQRVDADAALLWSPEAVPVCVTPILQASPNILTDGVGGAIFTWAEVDAADITSIRAQRLDGSGAQQWAPEGAMIQADRSCGTSMDLVSDGSGGAIIGWCHHTGAYWDIRGHRVDAGGNSLWPDGGVAICIDEQNQTGLRMISDDAGGVIVVWSDTRSGDSDIYAQQVDADGLLGGPENQPPVALADVTPTSGTEPLTVSFDAGASYDPEGMPLEYDWDFGDGSPHSAAMVTSHIYTSPGNYQALLTVTDDQLLTDTYPVAIEVDAVINQPPVAVAQASPPSGYAPHTVGFGASGSYDPDGTPLDYFWDFGDPGSPSNTSDQENPTHVYQNPGTYTAWLTVSDGELTDSAPVTVQVMRTLSAEMTCWPQVGVLPFDCQITGALNNEYASYHRRLAATVTVYLPNGEHFTNYKRGFTNLAPASSHSFSWTEHLSSSDMVGAIEAQLLVQDVTPTPYNQPPYPSSGATASAGCLVEVVAE